MDARESFCHLGPGLPESQVFLLQHNIRGCVLYVSINCFVALLQNILSAAVHSAEVGDTEGERE